MKHFLDNDIFKAWNTTQKELWENLSKALPAFHPPADLDLRRDTYLRHLSTWESVVEQSLAVQKTWLEEWAAGMTVRDDAPEPIAEWTRQVEEVMQGWIDAQTELWDNWFKMLRSDEEAPEHKDTAPAESKSIMPLDDDTPAPNPVENKPVTPVADSAPVPAPAEPVHDDLKKIKGIGPSWEKQLNARGISSYRQVAALSADEIKQLEAEVVKFFGRIGRDDWIGQAKTQHLEKYGEQL